MPEGLASFPACRSRAVFLRDMLERFPDLFEGDGIDVPLQGREAADIDPDDWMPSVEVVLALTMVRDRVHATDDEFLAWNYERQLRIYRRPLFRALMLLFSPTLLFMSATRRWKTFHEGSELLTSGDKRSAQVTLAYPPGLYSRPFRVSLVASFRAALTACRAEQQYADLVDDEPGQTRYAIGWG
ncbi:MAG: hypothetical protein ACRBN8_38055 [Nannocystales bacterium]